MKYKNTYLRFSVGKGVWFWYIICHGCCLTHTQRKHEQRYQDKKQTLSNSLWHNGQKTENFDIDKNIFK